MLGTNEELLNYRNQVWINASNVVWQCKELTAIRSSRIRMPYSLCLIGY